MARSSDFVTHVRQESASLLDTVDKLNALKREWDALDYGNTLGDDAFEGSNSEVTLAEVTAVIGVTLTALNDLMAQGHGSNLYKML